MGEAMRSTQTTFTNRKILLVEDDTVWQLLIGQNLKKNAFHTDVHFATSAEQAERMMADEPDFDLVITDQYLDGYKTGLDLCHTLAHSASPVPCILLSSMESEDFYDYLKEFHDLPAPKFLSKSHSFQELGRSMESAIATVTQLPKITFHSSMAIPAEKAISLKEFAGALILRAMAMGLFLYFVMAPRNETIQVDALSADESVSGNVFTPSVIQEMRKTAADRSTFEALN
jgi:DNA-binding response OmpR family regulator